MKKLLATSALTLVAFAGAASAQSVLERVLSQIDNSTNLASVNGTFANIAENIGSVGSVTVYVDNNGDTISQSAYDAELAAQATTNINTISYSATSGVGATPGWTYGGTVYASNAAATAAANSAAADSMDYNYNALELGMVEGINGSVNNVITGLDVASMTAIVGSVSAVEYLLPTVNLGAISTTVLGAVNTGEITLGVNQSVDQAKTSTTGALSSVVEQLGGSADTGALVLNIASNMTGVNGSINNTMTGVNGAVGAASTTVLGAVNTGTIVSGVNAAVAGIVGGTTQNSPAGL
jgi:hypothetical protein